MNPLPLLHHVDLDLFPLSYGNIFTHRFHGDTTTCSPAATHSIQLTEQGMRGSACQTCSHSQSSVPKDKTRKQLCRIRSAFWMFAEQFAFDFSLPHRLFRKFNLGMISTDTLRPVSVLFSQKAAKPLHLFIHYIN